MNLDDLQKLRELHKLFVDLVNILEQEAEKNWILAIKQISERIDNGLLRSCEYEEIFPMEKHEEVSNATKRVTY